MSIWVFIILFKLLGMFENVHNRKYFHVNLRMFWNYVIISILATKRHNEIR